MLAAADAGRCFIAAAFFALNLSISFACAVPSGSEGIGLASGSDGFADLRHRKHSTQHTQRSRGLSECAELRVHGGMAFKAEVHCAKHMAAVHCARHRAAVH